MFRPIVYEGRGRGLSIHILNTFFLSWYTALCPTLSSAGMKSECSYYSQRTWDHNKYRHNLNLNGLAEPVVHSFCLTMSQWDLANWSHVFALLRCLHEWYCAHNARKVIMFTLCALRSVTWDGNAGSNNNTEIGVCTFTVSAHFPLIYFCTASKCNWRNNSVFYNVLLQKETRKKWLNRSLFNPGYMK